MVGSEKFFLSIPVVGDSTSFSGKHFTTHGVVSGSAFTRGYIIRGFF